MELPALKIGEKRPVGAGARVGGVSAARGAAKTASVAAPAAVQDTTSVLGITDTEFTPKVRAAIMMLLQEVDSLRHDLDQSKKRIQHLDKLADQDTLTPVANRRAFVRELSSML